MVRQNPQDKIVGDLTREVLALPERHRVKVFERLREDVADLIAPDRADALNARIEQALEAFAGVAGHLGLDDDGIRALTMREFDATPEAVRQGWSAKRVAAAYFDSWPLVKQMAALPCTARPGIWIMMMCPRLASGRDGQSAVDTELVEGRLGGSSLCRGS